MASALTSGKRFGVLSLIVGILATVSHSTGEYPIFIEEDATSLLKERAARLESAGHRFAVITDDHILDGHQDWWRANFPTAPLLAIPPGEVSKSLTVLGEVYDFLARHHLDRSGEVWAWGGGVVGDLTGFAAATWLRGVDFVQIPTTLLAMVDSSVGGKTGINIPAGKNLAGAFHPPQAVYISLGFIQTLPAREISCGMAEVLKTGLLGDAGLFARVAAQSLPDAGCRWLMEAIASCCRIKAEIVQRDEKETSATDGRALLNLGHTFAHAIETVAGYGVFLHGEAVGIGLAAAARLSEKLGLISHDIVGLVEESLVRHGLSPRFPGVGLPLELLMEAMSRDKKVRHGRLRFVVLHSIGHARTHDDVPLEAVQSVWREVGAR